MKNTCKTAAFLMLLILVLTGCESGGENTQNARTEVPATPGVLVVSYSEASADTIAPPGTDSMIVMDWLRYGCDSLELAMEIQEYAFGDLVIGIGATHNGDEGYWLYKVNGESVPKAVSAHRVSSADTVMFYFK